MIDNLWIAIVVCFTISLFLFIRIYHAETLAKELGKQINAFLELQTMHNSRLNERVYVLEKRDKFRRVK